MDKLVSQDGKEAAMRLSEEFEGKEAPFDPLVRDNGLDFEPDQSGLSPFCGHQNRLPTSSGEAAMPATLLHVDSRKRVTLPVESNIDTGDDLELEVLEDGRLVLTPIVRIPKHQLWLLSHEVDEILSNAAKDDSPMLNMSKPGALDALRKRLLAD
jgi:hypothetical protein